MKCEKCNQNDANFHYKATIDGQTQEMNLCSSCAQQMGLDVMCSESWPFSGLFSELFGMPGFVTGAQLKAEPAGDACPLCGRSLRDLRNTGRLGCSQCYQHFGPQLAGYFERLHGNAVHKGKVPAAASEALRSRRQRETLQQQLQEAVEAQHYEQAVVLRDQLKALESGRAEEGGAGA